MIRRPALAPPPSLTSTFLTIFVLLGMAGCIPVLWERYYKPEVAEATLQSSRCGGGPQKVANFTVDSVQVGYALFPQDDRVSAMMRFVVPEGQTVRLNGTRIAIRLMGDGGNEGQLREIRQGWQGFGKGSLSTDQAMVGVTKQHSFPTFQEHAFYVTSIDISISPPTKVTVTFPGFVVNDRPVGPRDIRYRLDRHIQFMAPINC